MDTARYDVMIVLKGYPEDDPTGFNMAGDFSPCPNGQGRRSFSWERITQEQEKAVHELAHTKYAGIVESYSKKPNLMKIYSVTLVCDEWGIDTEITVEARNPEEAESKAVDEMTDSIEETVLTAVREVKGR